MTGPSYGNQATRDLHRLLAVGRPADGNTVPLYEAMRDAELIVPVMEGLPLILSRPRKDRPGEQERFLSTFTDKALALRLPEGLTTPEPVAFTFASLVPVCQMAIDRRIDVIDIDRGGRGYTLGYRGMVDLLSCTAFDGKKTVVFREVKRAFFVPDPPPPPEWLGAIVRMATAHGIQKLGWCFARIGDAPPELQLEHTPYPHADFASAVLAHFEKMYRGHFTFGVHDASGNAASRAMRRLLPT